MYGLLDYENLEIFYHIFVGVIVKTYYHELYNTVLFKFKEILNPRHMLKILYFSTSKNCI